MQAVIEEARLDLGLIDALEVASVLFVHRCKQNLFRVCWRIQLSENVFAGCVLIGTTAAITRPHAHVADNLTIHLQVKPVKHAKLSAKSFSEAPSR